MWQVFPPEGWRGPVHVDTWCPRGPPDHREDDGDWDYDDVHVVHLIHYDHDDDDDGDYDNDHDDLAIMIFYNL